MSPRRPTASRAALRSDRREEFLDRVLATSICGIYVYDVVEGRNDYINLQYEQITGWSLPEINAMSGAEFAGLFHPDDRDAVMEHIAGLTRASDEEILEVEYRFRTKSGRWIWCLSRDATFERMPGGRLRRFIGTFLDITERKRQEEERRELDRQLELAQRTESLGVLAGGVAHDFNNILTAILGHAELALRDVPADGPLAATLGEIRSASERAADLCHQMLAYAGRGNVEQEDFLLGALVRETLPLVRGGLSGKDRLEADLGDLATPVHGNAAQVQQVVLNLVINAAEALGEGGGSVRVATGTQRVGAEGLPDDRVPEPPEPGEYAFVEVSDTGAGIEPENVGRIFEPFFTTKFTGRGLGLAAVLGIVRSHGGRLTLRSEVGAGTTFRALFPAASGPAPAEPDGKRADVRDAGGKTVLLVDDEPLVRTIAGKLLRRVGCDVVSAEDGSGAVELFRERGSGVALVLLDLSMPGMSGEDTFYEIRKIDPEVPVVVASGYSEEDFCSRFSGSSRVWFLAKPYTIDRLRERLAAAGIFD